jgi:hypothetical protein
MTKEATIFSHPEIIYQMKMHERLYSDGLGIIRVPGGWMYIQYSPHTHVTSNTFVPFHNEFQPEKDVQD